MRLHCHERRNPFESSLQLPPKFLLSRKVLRPNCKMCIYIVRSNIMRNFCSAIRLTGPFVTMIYSMITGDMLTFGIIYTVLLFGFSQSFYFLYKGFPGVQSSLYHSYPSTWMALFQITLGDYSVSLP